jgi:hypothetical protein
VLPSHVGSNQPPTIPPTFPSVPITIPAPKGEEDENKVAPKKALGTAVLFGETFRRPVPDKLIDTGEFAASLLIETLPGGFHDFSSKS